MADINSINSTFPALSAESVKMSYGTKEVLKNVNMLIPKGQAVALLGPNGAGKSTFLKIITGLIRPIAGNISIMGKDPLCSDSSIFENIGYVSEKRGLWPWLTIEETISLISGLSSNWDNSECSRLIKDFSLDTKSKTGNLSKGEQGKLSLLLTLSCKPDLLIMDEPTAGLDPLVRRSILEEIINLMLEQGKTIIYSTHEMHEAERLAEKVFMINKGEIILEDFIDNLKKNHCIVSTSKNMDQEKNIDIYSLNLKGLINFSESSSRININFNICSDENLKILSSAGFCDINVKSVNLEDIFCQYCKREEL
jgi:ABC-2 type transport system ATP-binding protein